MPVVLHDHADLSGPSESLIIHDVDGRITEGKLASKLASRLLSISHSNSTRISEARRAYAPARLFDFRSKTGAVVWRR